MDITALFGFLAALSVATERITETIKGFPFLSKWLATEQAAGAAEELRQSAIHVIAIGVGTTLVWLIKGQLPATFPVKITDFGTSLVFGAMTSGGSALWNSALDITREVNKQKQILTTQLEAGSPATHQAKKVGAGQ